MVHLGDLAGSAARDLRAGPDFELLDANRHGCDPRMSQDDGCDPFGERFGQRYMLLRDDHSDRIGDHVIGEHVANVLWHVLGAEHLHVHIEPDILRSASFMNIGPDANRQDEIAHENAIGLAIVLARVG